MVSEPSLIDIEVAYATADCQVVVPLQVPLGTTIEQAIKLSGIDERCPEIDITKQPVGIFGKQVKLTTLVTAGDRVEIYRPLLIDPKQARRQRAQHHGKA